MNSDCDTAMYYSTITVTVIEKHILELHLQGT